MNFRMKGSYKNTGPAKLSANLMRLGKKKWL